MSRATKQKREKERREGETLGPTLPQEPWTTPAPIPRTSCENAILYLLFQASNAFRIHSNYFQKGQFGLYLGMALTPHTWIHMVNLYRAEPLRKSSTPSALRCAHPALSSWFPFPWALPFWLRCPRSNSAAWACYTTQQPRSPPFPAEKLPWPILEPPPIN